MSKSEDSFGPLRILPLDDFPCVCVCVVVEREEEGKGGEMGFCARGCESLLGCGSNVEDGDALELGYDAEDGSGALASA